MLLLDASNVGDYLRTSRRIDPTLEIRVAPLSGGVSNIVLRVEPRGDAAFVIKQSREQLRTEAPWFSRLDRIWRETSAINALRLLLPDGVVPHILFEDRENYLFAMEAVDGRHTVWKDELLAGRVRPEIARALGAYLSMIHGRTRGDAACERTFGDREIFVQLRVDPFYRRISAVHAELYGPVENLIDEMWNTRACLVHADFSPKNVLTVERSPAEQADAADPHKAPASTRPAERPPSGVPPEQRPSTRLTLIDFETVHYGDPAFDLGFFLSHLLLKGVRAGVDAGRFTALMETFWQSYKAGVAPFSGDPAFELVALERRATAHLAGCALARIDGTSPVGYLPEPGRRDLVRRLCRRVLLEKIDRVSLVSSLLQAELAAPGAAGRSAGR